MRKFLIRIHILEKKNITIKGEKEKSYKRGYKDAYKMYKSTGVIPEYFNSGDDIEDKVSYKIGFYDATTEMRRE